MHNFQGTIILEIHVQLDIGSNPSLSSQNETPVRNMASYITE